MTAAHERKTPFVPTPRQADFIANAPPECVLTACPGSGKTYTAVRKFIEQCSKSRGGGVAYLSYTNVAVDEAMSRARELGAEAVVAYPNRIDTLDGFFRSQVFEPFIESLLQEVPVIVEMLPDRGPYPREAEKEKAFEISGIRPPPAGVRFSRPLKAWEACCFEDAKGEDQLAFEFFYKNDADDWVRIPLNRSREIIKAKANYVKAGFATFNDILLFSAILLRSPKRRVAEITAARFRQIIVDEAQDTTALQQAMLSRLVAHGTQISFVGDPKQGIYRFNGANPAFLRELINRGHADWSLDQNFRSVEEIVGVVNRHFGTEMTTERRRLDEGHGAYVFVGTWEAALARFDKSLSDSGIEREDAAVLVRSRSHLGNVLRQIATTGWSMAPRHAVSAWRAHRCGDSDAARTAAVRLLRGIVDPTWPGFSDENQIRQVAWALLRFACPEPALESPKAWGERLKDMLSEFLSERDLPKHHSFGLRTSSAKLPATGTAREKFSFAPVEVRSTVIHQVKGETIRAVLVVAPEALHDEWLKNADGEESNICYVAFTRAADLLIVQCPDEARAARWRERGFADLR